MQIKKSMRNLGAGLKQSAPEIMMISGAIGIVTTIVLACKATLKVEDIVDEAKADLDDVNAMAEENEFETPTEYHKEQAKVYAHTAWELFKIYAPAAGLGTLSMVSMFASNQTLKKRCAKATTAATITGSMLAELRKNIVDKYGEEEYTKLRYGIKEETVETEVTDEKVRPRKSKRKFTHQALLKSLRVIRS